MKADFTWRYVLIGAALMTAGLNAADFVPADPGWMPSKLYFAGGALRPRVMSLVSDPAAPTGQAGYAEAGANEAGGLADSYTYETIPGRYRTTFFFKVADNRSEDVVFQYFVWGAVRADPRAGTGSPWAISVRASDFSRPNVYQAFTYDWEYYGVGYMVVSGTWYGKADLWWGGFETKLLEAFDDNALLEKWRHPPEQTFYVPFPPQGAVMPPDIRAEAEIPRGAPRIHMAEGMYFDRFGVEEAVRLLPGATLTESETVSGSQTADICPTFPGAEDMLKHNVLILANVDIRRLGLLRRYTIKDLVSRGGGLLVLGGPWTYGRCAMHGTWVDELLPVTLDGRSDWIELPPASPLRWTGAAPAAMRDTEWDEAVCVRYVHRATLREGGQVFLDADGRPVLAAWQRGRGRVAAFLGTPMGEAGDGGVGFWDSTSWPPAMARLIQWLAGE